MLLYYMKERLTYDEEFKHKLTFSEFRYIFNHLKAHYKFRQDLEFGGRRCGTCSRYKIMISTKNGMTVGTLAHEVAHALQLKKIPTGSKVRWHNKKHKREMKRVLRYINSHISQWKERVKVKEKKSRTIFSRQRERKEQIVAYRKTPEYKLKLVQKTIKRWETKMKRAQNAIKKLHKREKYYINKRHNQEQTHPANPEITEQPSPHPHTDNNC